jgi:predicted ATPase
MAVPATLQASLMARLDRLGVTVKEVAQVGATIGPEFSYALLTAVMRKHEQALQSALDRLVTAGLLFQQGVPPNATYLFKHALIQDAAYGTLLREPRRALHARIADTLERRPDLGTTGLSRLSRRLHIKLGVNAQLVPLSASASAPSRTAPGLANGMPGYAGTISHDHTRPTTHTGLRDRTVRLMQRRERHCLCSGSESLRNFCSPQHTDSALYPVIGQMERAAGFTYADSPQAKLDKLDALLAQGSTSAHDAALFAEMLSLPNDGRYPAPQLTPQRRRLGTLEALVLQVTALSRKNPVLMIFEDAHWTDPTSLELFGRIVDKIPTLRVLLIVAFRQEFEPPWIGRPYVTAVTINRLAEREVSAMIDRVVGNKLLPASVRQDIIERTDGIALFVEEMTKAIPTFHGRFRGKSWKPHSRPHGQEAQKCPPSGTGNAPTARFLGAAGHPPARREGRGCQRSPALRYRVKDDKRLR